MRLGLMILETHHRNERWFLALGPEPRLKQLMRRVSFVKMTISIGWLFFLVLAPLLASEQRKTKIFSLFNVVRFRNDNCFSLDEELEGICYTGEDCRARRGRASGSCAKGFGVCCIFEVGCGQTFAENCTLFTSGAEGQASHFCTTKICPLSSEICQLRLDFIVFDLSGPSTDATPIGVALNGDLVDGVVGAKVTKVSRCEEAFFQATIPGSNPSSILCGQNTGHHMYLDASQDCNELSVFQTSPEGNQWMIKVSHLACSSPSLAPSGCTQWFFGPASGSVQTFNFDGGIHLADQIQTICIRRESNICSICWFPSSPLDFQLSGAGMMGITDDNLCCGYGVDGKDSRGYDCLLIPGASSVAGGIIKANRFCGASKGLAMVGSQTALNTNPVTQGIQLDQTICSAMTPFIIRFISDSFEFENEAKTMQSGFKLGYQLKPCL